MPKKVQPFVTNTLLATVIFMVSSCNPQYEPPDSAIDCGRQFIYAIYNGNFKRARQLMVSSEKNNFILRTLIEKDFRSRDSRQKEALSRESIHITQLETAGPDTLILHFTNAYTERPEQIKVVKHYDSWLVHLEGWKAAP